jgi:hypothetical protein
MCFARFNGFAVSRFAVSMPAAFDAMLFQWLTLFLGFCVLRTFQWLRRFCACGV